MREKKNKHNVKKMKTGENDEKNMKNGKQNDTYADSPSIIMKNKMM